MAIVLASVAPCTWAGAELSLPRRLRRTHSSAVICATSSPRSSKRRMSASVMTPTCLPPPSTTTVMPMPLDEISYTRSAKPALGRTRGSSSPWIITSATDNNSRLPSVPLGWNLAKSRSVSPFVCCARIASASQTAIVVAALVVGAKSNSSISGSAGISRAISAAWAKRESGSVTEITWPSATALNWRANSMVSALPPLFDSASIAEPWRTMPKSPCSASTGCTNAACVPVLESVAAAFCAIRPLLPKPVTMSMESRPAINRTAFAKRSSSNCRVAAMAAA